MADQPQWKPRELEILQLMAEGLTNVEIGARLYLSHDTVRWYNKQLFIKLNVRNRTEAVKRADELGLLSAKRPTPIINKSAVQYVQNDGVHVAYQTVGDGPVDVLFIHGFISHLDVAWENPEFTNFFHELAQVSRVILFDKRGVGLSDRIQGAPTLDNTVADAIHVLDAASSKRTFVLGTSEGAAAAVLLASTHPDRVAGLILYAATPKVVRTGGKPEWASESEAFDAMIERMQRSWGSAWALENFAPSRAQDEVFRAWWAKILKSASSPSSVKDVLNLIRQVDIRRLLPQIQTRTLVIHKRNDRLVSLDAGKYFADNMPNAQWLELEGNDHIYFVHGEAILSAVSKFIRDTSTVKPVETRISVILCAQSRSGTMPTQAQIELRTHKAHYMLLGKTDLMGTFDSPAQAVNCATRLLELFRGADLRVTLHVGECDVNDGKPLGHVADLSRKALEFASTGEILVTQTLHDILAGSRLRLRPQSDKVSLPAAEDMVLYTLV